MTISHAIILKHSSQSLLDTYIKITHKCPFIQGRLWTVHELNLQPSFHASPSHQSFAPVLHASPLHEYCSLNTWSTALKSAISINNSKHCCFETCTLNCYIQKCTKTRFFTAYCSFSFKLCAALLLWIGSTSTLAHPLCN